jgi:hypothetical protein
MRRQQLILGIAALGIVAIGLSPALWAGAGRGREAPPREVTLEGRVVDLHSYMSGKHASDDHDRATQQALRSGVPAALEVEDGVVILGHSGKGGIRSLFPLANKEAELIGMLYDKEGIRYLAVSSAKQAKKQGQEGEDEWDMEKEPPGYDPDGPPDE